MRNCTCVRVISFESEHSSDIYERERDMSNSTRTVRDLCSHPIFDLGKEDAFDT